MLELLVTMSIGVLILSTVIGGQSKYTDSAALKGLVNDVSLDLRSAQVYGISVKVNPNANTDFTGAYGLSFNTANPSDYVSFVDRGGVAGTYDGNHTTCSGECISINPINRGNHIVNPLCRIPTGGGAEDCTVSRADITFVRPSTEAKIAYYNSSGVSMSPTGYKGLRVKFISPGGLTRSVVIYTSGQISVQ